MSSPEVEKFEISDRDWEDAINMGRGGGPRRMSKQKTLYGVWADSDSDEEPGGGRGGKSYSKKGKANYAAPLAFVSGGIKQGDKITKDGGDQIESLDGEEIQEPEDYLTSRGGTKKPKRHDGVFVSKDKEFGRWEKHTKGIGQKLLQKMGYQPGKGLGVRAQGIIQPVEAHKRRDTKATIAYHGSERPKSSIPEMVEVEEKPQAPHVQQWKRREDRKKAQYTYKTVQEVIDSGAKKKGLKATSAESKVKVIDMTGREQKVMSGYRSISKRHDRPGDDPDSDATDGEKAFDVPELTHNLNLLLDMAEEEIILNDRKIRHGQDRMVNMTYEKDRLEELCEHEAKQITRMNKILDIVESCEERLKPTSENPLTLDEAAAIFQGLQNDCYEEYKLYDLSSLSVVIVFPLMKQYLQPWKPFTNPTYGLDVMRQWRYLIEDPNRQFQQDHTTSDPYQRLVWEIWLPSIRSAILAQDMRQCEPVISLLEHWMPVLPGWILANIITQLIMPRLVVEVDKWNPLTDTMPIHLWLQPWLPLIGERLVPLYAPIRHKLANALTNWHPSDNSAKMILQPWVTVFKPGQMEAFVTKNILPKLAICMQDFQINPHTQLLDPWNWVMSWCDYIPIDAMVAMLDKTFFPRWQQVLLSWLTSNPNYEKVRNWTRHFYQYPWNWVMSWCDYIPIDAMVAMLDKTFFPRWQQVLLSWLTSNPNYEEVRNWYLGWKSMFPEKFVNHPTVKVQLSKALDFMNQAVSGSLPTSTKDNVSNLKKKSEPSKTSKRSESRDVTVTPKSTVSSSAYSFKDLIQRKAEDNSLLFMPMPGKTHEAKQVYRFGCKQVYLDRNVIFTYDNSRWVPVSLQSLVDSAR